MSHAGRLLVATPLIADPTFERTVVLLLAHGPEGAFGVVLNRPSDTSVAEVAPVWAEAVASPRGGLRRWARRPGRTARPRSVRGSVAGGAEVLAGGYAPVDLHRSPDDPSLRWTGVRLFAGSAGWAPGQLEDELAEGAWWPVDAEADDLLTTDPEGLWAVGPAPSARRDCLVRQPSTGPLGQLSSVRRIRHATAVA